jgi:hypothetical protein
MKHICLFTRFTTHGVCREAGHMAWPSATAAFQYGRLIYGPATGVELAVCESPLCAVQEAIDTGIIQDGLRWSLGESASERKGEGDARRI